jgi:hypothetical protein
MTRCRIAGRVRGIVLATIILQSRFWQTSVGLDFNDKVHQKKEDQ